MAEPGSVITATVDWCESNYAISPFIAEFWNTISSVPMIFMGIIGVIKVKESSYFGRHSLAFAGLAIVGFGSAMFHGTLKRSFQLLDELPMLIVNHIFIYCLVNPRDEPNKSHYGPLLACSAVVECILYVFLEWYWVFIVGYGGGLIVQWYLMFPRLRKGLGENGFKMFVVTIASYYTGLLLWTLENLFCSHLEAFQFHAWWHLMAGYGTYCWIWALLAIRFQEKDKSGADIEYLFNIPIAVTIVPNKED